MNKPILFCDFDGTICHDRLWRSLPAEKNEEVQKLLFRDDVSKAHDWMKGNYTSEEINQFVAERIGVPYKELWDVFVKDCNTMHVPSSTLSKLSELRMRYRVILITINTDSFSRFTAPSLQLEKYFDNISNSYYEKKFKTDMDGAIFIDHAATFGASISDCILIDDNSKAIDIFNALGGKTCPITPEKDIGFYLETI